MANTVNLGSVYGSLSLDATQWNKGIQSAKSSLDNFAKSASKSMNVTAKTLNSAISSMGKGLDEIGHVGLVAGAAITGLGIFSGMASARIDELTLALHAIAKANNITADSADNAVKALRANNIAYDKALQVTANFISANLDLTDAIKLSNAAKDLAVVAGLDSSAATETLTQAIVTNQTQMLQQFGILTTQTQAYSDYGKSIGKSADDLSQFEKQQAILSVVLKQGERVAGTYEAAYGSVSKRFRSLTGRILPDFIAVIGKPFEPAMAIVIDAVIEKIGVFSKWLTDNQDVVAEWGKKLESFAKTAVDAVGKVFDWLMNNKEVVIGALSAIAIGLGYVAAAFVVAHAPAILMFTAITALVTLFQKNKPLFAIIASALVGLGVGIASIVVPAFIALHGAAIAAIVPMLATIAPFVAIGIAIGVVIAAIYLLVKNWDKVKAVLLNAWIAILGAWQKAHDFLVGLITGIGNKIGEFVTGLITFFTQTLPTAITTFFTQTIPTFITNFINGIKQMFINAAGAFFEGIGFLIGLVIYGVPMVVEAVINFFKELPAKIGAVMTDVATSIGDGITNAWNWLKTNVPIMIENLIKFFFDFNTKLIVWSANVIATFIKWGADLWSFLKTNVPIWINNVVTWVGGLPARAGAALASLASMIMDKIKSAWDAVTKEVSTWPKRFFDWGVNIAKEFINGIGQIGDFIADKIKSGLEKAKKLLKGNSPPKEGPLHKIDEWGFNVGQAWVNGLGLALSQVNGLMGGLSTVGSVGLQPSQAVVGSSPVSNSTVNVYIGMYAGSPMEKRQIAKELNDALNDYNKGVGL